MHGPLRGRMTLPSFNIQQCMCISWYTYSHYNNKSTQHRNSQIGKNIYMYASQQLYTLVSASRVGGVKYYISGCTLRREILHQHEIHLNGITTLSVTIHELGLSFE